MPHLNPLFIGSLFKTVGTHSLYCLYVFLLMLLLKASTITNATFSSS
jgi:hypothetical protein